MNTRALAALVAAPLILVPATAYASSGHDRPMVCHPVNGKGETGHGWNLISPDKASSHIDPYGNPKHVTSDGRKDAYAVDGVCPSGPASSPSPSQSSGSPSPSASVTPSASPSVTPSASPSTTPSATPSSTPSTTPSVTLTPEPTETANPEPTGTASPSPSVTVTATPTPSGATPSASTPAPAPSVTVTPEPAPSETEQPRVPRVVQTDAQQLAHTGTTAITLVALGALLAFLGAVLIGVRRRTR